MVGVLRAAGGPEEARRPAPQPDLAELPRLIGMSGLDVTYEPGVVAGGRGAQTLERAAFRTVQEALTNVRKHAPGARVLVRIDPLEAPDAGRATDATVTGGLRVEIRNGPPDASAAAPALPGGGHGLVGLRERAQSLGGTLETRHTSEGGFVVCARFPYRTEPPYGTDSPYGAG
jgi:signal transduction histidine kinase